MDNILIVVEDLEVVKTFLIEIGMELEGETTWEGPSVDSVVGLKGVRAAISLLRTPDGNGNVKLTKYDSPAPVRMQPERPPANALAIRRIMFDVDDVDAVVSLLGCHGAELVGKIAQYKDRDRLCFVRGPERILNGLAAKLC